MLETSMLKMNKNLNEELEGALKDIIPLRGDVKTMSQIESFSNEYKLLAPNKLKSHYYSSLSHIGFNYAVRFMIGRVVERNRCKSFLNMKAYRGLIYLKPYIKQRDYEYYKEFYEEAIAYMMEYVYSRSDVIENLFNKNPSEEELAGYKKFISVSSLHDYKFKMDDERFIRYIVFFAKLELIYQCETLLPNMHELTKLDDGLYYDILKLCNIFKSKFIMGKLININSDVVYEINLGDVSYMLKRDSSYIYVDNIIYDLNTREKNEYVWSDFAKLISYYILNECSNDKKINIKFKDIKRIAIYKARYGEIEYVDISDIKYENISKSEVLVKSILNK